MLKLFGSGGSGGKEPTVADLVARRRYPQAIEILREALRREPGNGWRRAQLADVLALAGKRAEANQVLAPLVDGFTRSGQFLQVIATLKKMQRNEPERGDIQSRLKAASELRAQVLAAPAAQAASAEEPAELSGDELGFAPLPEAPAAEIDQLPPPDEASPLLEKFADADLGALVGGLRLRGFEPGDVIVAQDAPGDSLFLITRGDVKAFVKNADGHYVKVRDMGAGSCFGEISVLSGRPRTATVTAASACELLELDRGTLQAIDASHPEVRRVLERDYQERVNNPEAEGIRRSTRTTLGT